MLKPLATFFLFSITALSFAQDYQPVKNPNTFKTQFSLASAKITSLKSDFVQEKNLSLLEETITSKGVFYFQKENKVRLEYREPFKYLMVINGTKVLVKDDQRENKMDMQSSKMFQQINQIMIDCVQGTAFYNPDFTIYAFEGDSEYKLKMIPAVKGLKEFFESIDIYVNKENFSATKLQMNEVGGDYTIITFNNKELNVALKDELFAVQ